MLLATPANQKNFLLSACLLLSAGFLVAGDISAYAKQPASTVVILITIIQTLKMM